MFFRLISPLALLFVATLDLDAQALRSNPGCRTHALERNDDGSSEAVPLGFRINLFGKPRDQAFVNNNGNLTFDEALSDYTPAPIREITREIIAAYWADVDTTGTRSNVVTYGQDTINSRRAFCTNYTDVGYFNAHDEKLNSFQIVLIEREDTGQGNFDIEFNYERILWETGDASGGENGFGGGPARVGYTNGTLDANASFELPGSGQSGAFLDSGPNALIRQSLNSAVPGRLVFAVRNGALRQSLTASPVSLLFRGPGATPASPAPQTLALTSNGGSLAFRAVTVNYVSGNNWLQVSPGSGATDANLTVTASATGLARGAYSAEIVVQPTDESIPPIRVPVVLVAGDQVPFSLRSGVVNGASFVSGVIVPGSIFSVFGENLAAVDAQASTPVLPDSLGNTSVQLNGRRIPLFFVSPQQINGVVPFDLAPGPATLVVAANGVNGPPVNIDVARTLPGVFLVPGTGDGIIQNQDYSTNSVTTPAAPGSVVIVYLTGIGAVDNPPTAGTPAPPSPLARAIATFRATIGGRNAPVQFAGLTPTFIGLAQVNVSVPEGLAGGPQQLVLFADNVAGAPVLVHLRP